MDQARYGRRVRASLGAARADAERSLRLATEPGDRSGQVLGEIVLGFAARKLGELDLAGALSFAGSNEQAARLLGAVTAERESTALSLSASENGDVDRAAARAREALGPDAFAAAVAVGAKLSLDEAWVDSRR